MNTCEAYYAIKEAISRWRPQLREEYTLWREIEQILLELEDTIWTIAQESRKGSSY